MTTAAIAGAANDAAVRVGHDPAQAIAALKGRLSEVRQLCETAAAGGDTVPPETVLAILDRLE